VTDGGARFAHLVRLASWRAKQLARCAANGKIQAGFVAPMFVFGLKFTANSLRGARKTKEFCREKLGPLEARQNITKERQTS
jgi:hypothetical protein